MMVELFIQQIQWNLLDLIMLNHGPQSYMLQHFGSMQKDLNWKKQKMK